MNGMSCQHKFAARISYWDVAANQYDYFGFDDGLWFTEEGSMVLLVGHDADTPIFTSLSREFNGRLGFKTGDRVPDEIESWPAGERWSA